jgi:hypothetical protein
MPPLPSHFYEYSSQIRAGKMHGIRATARAMKAARTASVGQGAMEEDEEDMPWRDLARRSPGLFIP